MNLQSPRELYHQLAFISYYFHWDLETVMALPHLERKKFCEEISRINRQANAEEKKLFDV